MISASSLLRVSRCPGSETLAHIGTSSKWTEEGTQRHEDIEADVRARGVAALPRRIRDLLPEGVGLMPEQVVYYDTASGKARAGVVDGRAYEPTATEIPMRIDLIALSRKRAVVIDWKSRQSVGRPASNSQLMLNGLAVARMLGLDEVTLAVAYIAEDVDEAPCSVDTVDVLALDAFAATLPGVLAAVEVQRGRDVPDVNQGEWCRHCPARQHCPATTALARRVINVEEHNSWRMMLPLDAERAAWLRERIILARAVLSDLESAVNACTLAEPDQRIRMPSGKWYGKRESTVEAVDALTARGVLARLCSQDVAEAATEYTTSKTAIKAAVTEYAKANGAKAAPLMREILDDIRTAGGIETKTRITMTEFAAELAESEAA